MRQAVKVPVPPIIRGAFSNSGSAQLVVIVALQQPGIDVLCSAPELRLAEMLAEVLRVVEATGIAHRIDMRGDAKIEFDNHSRIVFRQPRRDGKGARGMNPTMVWLDEADRFAVIEAHEQVRRGSGLTVSVEAAG